MQWINHFSTSKIPFYIYKLNKGDSIIYTPNKKNNKSIIILHGIAYLLKIFTNQEISTLAILNQGNIIFNRTDPKYYYYTIVAINKTFLLSFKWQDLIYNKNINPNFLYNIISSHQATIYTYEMMNNILSHKYTKHRVIQLILFLCKEFGSVEKNQIIIPFYISQITISVITGSNRGTINKIINKLCKNHAISYSHQKYISIIDPFILSYSD